MEKHFKRKINAIAESLFTVSDGATNKYVPNIKKVLVRLILSMNIMSLMY